MDSELFEKELMGLSMMCGSDQSEELFNFTYEQMLKEINTDPNKQRQQAQAARLRKLCDHQFQHLTQSWLDAAKQETMI